MRDKRKDNSKCGVVTKGTRARQRGPPDKWRRYSHKKAKKEEVSAVYPDRKEPTERV